MHKSVLLLPFAMALFPSCSSGDDAPAKEWRCYVDSTSQGTYCECRFAEPGKHARANEDASAFKYTSCPHTNYKCCETRAIADSWNGLETCVCWNSESIPFCNGEDPIVSACPQ